MDAADFRIIIECFYQMKDYSVFAVAHELDKPDRNARLVFLNKLFEYGILKYGAMYFLK